MGTTGKFREERKVSNQHMYGSAGKVSGLASFLGRQQSAYQVGSPLLMRPMNRSVCNWTLVPPIVRWQEVREHGNV